jgi:hypothetical protein
MRRLTILRNTGPLKYDSLHKFLADFAGQKQGHKAKKAHDDL